MNDVNANQPIKITKISDEVMLELSKLKDAKQAISEKQLKTEKEIQVVGQKVGAICRFMQAKVLKLNFFII
jgi:hypothetical protein